MFQQHQQQTKIEQWRPIPGYDGIYEVSDLGRVRKLIDRHAHPAGMQGLTRRSNGYLYIRLFDGVKTKGWLVHRLVLTAFVGPMPPEIHGAHINAVRDDNRLVNLHWCTPKQNEADKFPLGLAPIGEKNAMAKLTPRVVREIRRDYLPRSRHRNCFALAKRYGICQQSVWNIVKSKTWAHVA